MCIFLFHLSGKKQIEEKMLIIKTLDSTRGISRRKTARSKAKDYHTKVKWR